MSIGAAKGNAPVAKRSGRWGCCNDALEVSVVVVVVERAGARVVELVQDPVVLLDAVAQAGSQRWAVEQRLHLEAHGNPAKLSACRMAWTTSRSMSFLLRRALLRRALCAMRSMSRREPETASCRMAMASEVKSSLVAP